jgi:VIT1/CCC1 family predicted Fe2+/Mn2+ transporter
MPRMDVTDLPPGTTRHVMSPEPPIRGFIIAGVLSIVGAVLMIVSIAKSWHEVVTIIFIAVLACGIALAVTAAWSMVHMKLYVDNWLSKVNIRRKIDRPVTGFFPS